MAVNATAVWRVRAGGSNTNGGGYDAGISGAGTDYSQQNTAQTTGTAGTASGTATFTDSIAASFTSAMVGNALWIASGAGFTAGAYFIITFNSSTSVVLDRFPGTGTGAAWALGGAWADPITNGKSSGPLVAGNTLSIRGAGSNNPTSVDYAMSGNNSITGGSATAPVTWIGENGRPLLSGGDRVFYGPGTFINFISLCVKSTQATNNGILQIGLSSQMKNCRFDQAGFDCSMLFNINGILDGCEIYSSTGGSGGTNAGIVMQQGAQLIDCNIHNTVGPGFSINSAGSAGSFGIVNTLVTRCAGAGGVISTAGGASISNSVLIAGSTFADNGGVGGLSLTTNEALFTTCIKASIFANHTGGTQSGISFTGAAAGTALAQTLALLEESNNFFNNHTNVAGFTASATDTTLDPQFTSATTGDYQTGTNMNANSQFTYPNNTTSAVPPTNYRDTGGTQHTGGGGGGGSSQAMISG